MGKTNLTISLEKDLLRSMKIIAAQNDTSITRLLIEMMEARAKPDANYERAKKRAMARMEKGWDLGFKPGTRDELHER